jgi:MFS family permease
MEVRSSPCTPPKSTTALKICKASSSIVLKTETAILNNSFLKNTTGYLAGALLPLIIRIPTKLGIRWGLVMAQRIVSNPAVFGWMWPAFGAAAIVSTLVAGGASKRMGNRKLWIASQLVMAVGVASPALFHHVFSVVVAAVLLGSTFMVTSMVAMQEAQQIGGDDPTSLMSAMTTCFAIGQVIGPLFANKLPHLADEFGGSLLLASFLLVLSACTLIRNGKIHRGSRVPCLHSQYR